MPQKGFRQRQSVYGRTSAFLFFASTRPTTSLFAFPPPFPRHASAFFIIKWGFGAICTLLCFNVSGCNRPCTGFFASFSGVAAPAARSFTVATGFNAGITGGGEVVKRGGALVKLVEEPVKRGDERVKPVESLLNAGVIRSLWR